MYSKQELVELLNIPKISSDRQYWLVRTDGGNLWEQFKANSFFAIGWNEVDISKIEQANTDPKVDYELRNIIKMNYDVAQPGKVISTIKRFFYDIKEGDIVMLPSEGSNIITFGEISSHAYTYEPTDEEIDEGSCDFKKRRNFKFLKDVNRKDLDPLLFKMFQAHQTISSANSYASVIDRTLENLYIKDGILHLKIDVKVPDDIKAKKILALQNIILNSPGCEVSDDIIMKISIQSDGFIELITSSITDILTALAIIQIFIGGAKINDYEIPGILSFIKSCKDMKLEKEKFEFEKTKHKFEKETEIVNHIKDIYGDKIKDLNIETPNEVLAAIIEVNKNLNPEIAQTLDMENGTINE